MWFLWVNKRDWRHPGPIVNVAVRNAHALAARGLETHLVLGAGAPSDTAADLTGFYGLPVLENLHLHRVPRRRLAGVVGAQSSVPIFARAARLALGRARRGERVTILTREAAFLPWLVALRRLSGNIRGFYEAHDFYADPAWFPADGRPLRWGDRRQGWLERRCLPRLDGLLCIAAPQLPLYRRLFPQLPAVALPLGTEPQPEDANTAPETRRTARRLVYVGHLNRTKGLATLFRAAPALARAGVRLALWGGYGAQASELLTAAGAEGWGAMVETAGFRPPAELRRDLATRASVGLVTLEDTFYNRHLTCPVKALDYLSHGLPTVASDLPATRAVLGADGGPALYVPPGNAAALAAAVLRLLDDADLYAHAAAAARARAAELSWDARARRLVEFVSGSGKA